MEVGFWKISKQTGHDKFSSALFGGKWCPLAAIFFVRVEKGLISAQFMHSEEARHFASNRTQLKSTSSAFSLVFDLTPSMQWSAAALYNRFPRHVVIKFQHGGRHAFIVWKDFYCWWSWTRFPLRWKVVSRLQTFWGGNRDRVKHEWICTTPFGMIN